MDPQDEQFVKCFLPAEFQTLQKLPQKIAQISTLYVQKSEKKEGLFTILQQLYFPIFE